ncbi:MAG: hypothetical protein Q7T44_08325 [Parvibaculum sp.]|nr:hypothetical protein [Parvibaculum sp.]
MFKKIGPETSPTKSDQRNSIVSGDQAGRDINITTNIRPATTSAITALYKRLDSEISENSQLQEKVDDLEYYLREAEFSLGKTLREKLIDGGRASEVTLATIQKERASKKLHRHSTKISAQKIYAFILSKLHNDFRAYITPLIENNYDKAVVEERISEKVIEPTLTFLESNILELTHDDIKGLIYLLTGNCHLEWAVYANVPSNI